MMLWQADDQRTHRATIIDVKQLTPSVKAFMFRAENQVHPYELVFKSGQWLDVFIPGVPVVGGFSLTTSPSTLPIFELAIQKSRHPPARYFHEHPSIVGSSVFVRVGGGFVYPPEAARDWDRIVFVAGGVGVNTIASMLAALREESKQESVRLLYSARRASDFYFVERLLSNRGANDAFRFFVSRASGVDEKPVGADGPGVDIIQSRRISERDLDEAIEGCERPLVYVCGPPPMTDYVVAHYQAKMVERLYYEKWW